MNDLLFVVEEHLAFTVFWPWLWSSRIPSQLLATFAVNLTASLP
jgi:hypothetical protein